MYIDEINLAALASACRRFSTFRLFTELSARRTWQRPVHCALQSLKSAEWLRGTTPILGIQLWQYVWPGIYLLIFPYQVSSAANRSASATHDITRHYKPLPPSSGRNATYPDPKAMNCKLIPRKRDPYGSNDTVKLEVLEVVVPQLGAIKWLVFLEKHKKNQHNIDEFGISRISLFQEPKYPVKSHDLWRHFPAIWRPFFPGRIPWDFPRHLWRHPRPPQRCRSGRWAAAPSKGPEGWPPWTEIFWADFIEILGRLNGSLKAI